MLRVALYFDRFDPVTKANIQFVSGLLPEYFDHIYLVPEYLDKENAVKRCRMCEIAVSDSDMSDRVSVLEIKKNSLKKQTHEALSLMEKLHPGCRPTIIRTENDSISIHELNLLFDRSSSERTAIEKIHHFIDPEELHPNVTAYIAANGIYQPCDEKVLKSALSKTRYQHTMGVRAMAVELAKRFKGPMIKSAVAAFYHDCAKELTAKEMRRICIGPLGRDESDEILSSGALMHGPVGAYLAEKVYGIADEDILNAIRYHTTGRVNMSLTEMIVFLADAIEPNRSDYTGLTEMRQLAQESLKAAMLLEMCLTKAHVMRSGKAYNSAGDASIEWMRQQCTDNEKDMVRHMINKLL